ncbi:MAG: translocation and assembly module lipoprotein TamL [Bacteroides sp.]
MQTLLRSAHAKKVKCLAPLVAFLIMLFAPACSSTKKIADDQYLVEKVELQIDNKPQDIDIEDDELTRYIQQQPNTKLFGLFKFNLWLYNLGKQDKETGFSGWLHRIGEPPVIYNSELARRSTQNIKTYLNSRGYYQANVSYTMNPKKKKKCSVTYYVTYNRPTQIESLRTQILDTTLRRLYDQSRAQALFRPADRLDAKLLENERIRLSRLFRNEGFYNLAPDQMGYLVDTIGSPYNARLTLRIPNDSASSVQKAVGKRYVIDSIKIYTQYSPIPQNLGLQNTLLTKSFDGLHFYFEKKPSIRFPVLAPMLLMRRDSLLRIFQINKSQQNILALGVYQTASFDLHESSSPVRCYGKDTIPHFYPINCDIRLTPLKRQGYQIEGLLTTSGSLGTEGGFTYRHRNLFNGAEQLDVQIRAQAEAVLKKTALGFKTALELGINTSLTIPRFLLPFKSKEFVRRYAPSTRILFAYNYQRRPYYRRTIATGYLSYNWKGSSTTSHSVIPLEIDIVKIFAIAPDFAERIRQSYLANSYISQLITLINYTFSYSDSSPNSRFATTLLRLNLETAGNMLFSASKSLKRPLINDTYQILELPFAQYIRGDINYSILFRTSKYSAWAGRVFVGIGYPYGNSKALPFEKRYFGGGANGVRAWHARDLGPGSYQDKKLSFPNQTGDVKLECNIEYRTWLFWKFDGALFIDAGNIWTIKSADERKGAKFEWNRFYKEFAVGYGVGLRLNLGFFLIRLDTGIKLYDPVISPDAEQNFHWIPIERDFSSNDFVLHFGVGYPF